MSDLFDDLEGQVLPDIHCASCGCTSEHKPDGKLGDGYYCTACGDMELERDRTPDVVDSQIDRRIVKR